MHPNAQKKQVQLLLQGDEIVTRAQLHRQGLDRGATLLSLPSEERTVTTHGKGSTQLVEFVAQESTVLTLPTKVLTHQVGMLELKLRRPLASGTAWGVAQRACGGGRHSIPDYLLYDSRSHHLTAVEIDVSYSRRTLLEKLLGAARTGYHGYILATTTHGRVGEFAHLAHQLYQQGQLPHLLQVEAWWIDFWSSSDRYDARRRRCRTKVDRSVWVRPEEGPRATALA